MDAPTTIFALPRRTGWPCLQHLAGAVAMCALVACSGDDAGGDGMDDGSGGSGDVAIPSDGADNGMGGAGQGGSDSVATGLGRPTPDIAPSAPPVEGEGDACRFSIECGARQVCLDDECIREERVDRDAVTFGEARWMPLRGGRQPTFLEEVSPLGWPTFAGAPDTTSRVYSWTYPGPSGPQLVFLHRYATALAGTIGGCEVGILGESFRVVGSEEFRCQVAAVDVNGDLGIIAPGDGPRSYRDPEFIRLSPQGEILWRAQLPQEVRWLVQDHQLPAKQPSYLFSGASVAFHQGTLYFALWIHERNFIVLQQGGPGEALIHSRHLDEDGLVDPNSLFAPEYGWLMTSGATPYLLVGDFYNLIPLVLQPFAGPGSSRSLGSSTSYSAVRYQQLTQDDWVVSFRSNGSIDTAGDEEYLLFRKGQPRIVLPFEENLNITPTVVRRFPSVVGSMMTAHPTHAIAVLEKEGLAFRNENAELQLLVPYPWEERPRPPSFAMLSRFELTMEGFLRVAPDGNLSATDELFDWMELTLRTEEQ